MYIYIYAYIYISAYVCTIYIYDLSIYIYIYIHTLYIRIFIHHALLYINISGEDRSGDSSLTNVYLSLLSMYFKRVASAFMEESMICQTASCGYNVRTTSFQLVYKPIEYTCIYILFFCIHGYMDISIINNS